MPPVALVLLIITIFVSAVFLTYHVRLELRRRRNMKHFANDEPLESTGDWD